MLDAIIGIYTDQLKLYNNVSDILKKYDSNENSLEITEYLKELENVDNTMDIIKELNNHLDELKEKYVYDNNLKDFIGDEIKKVETPEKYNELKSLVNNLGSIISDIKKMQDRIISNITKQMDVTRTLLQEVNNSKKAVLNYKKLDTQENNKYLNKKK